MTDNRKYIKRRGIRGNEYCLASGGNQTRIEADVLALRDEMRAVFSDTARYKVSGIARWIGVTGTLGYAFILRDTTKGCEWLFGFGGRSDSSTQGWMYQIWGNNSAATYGAYYKTPSGAAWNNPATSNSANGNIFFNPDYATVTFAMGFANTTDLTYTAGADFQAPASSPYSALSTFMGAIGNRYHGVDLAFGSANNAYNRWCYIYDEPRGLLSLESSYGSSYGGGFTLIGGKELFPTNLNGGVANVLDARRDGVVYMPRLQGSAGGYNTLEASAPILIMFVRDNGTTIETLGRFVNITNDFTRANYLAGGNVQKRKLQVNASGYIKGYVDVEIMCEAFPYNDGAFHWMPLALPDVDNPMVKFHPQLCTFYKKGLAPFMIIPEPGLPIT